MILVAALLLGCWFVSPSAAQSGQADELNKRVIALYQAGKYAEAIPPAQRVLAIREKALGPDHPDVATALNNLAVLYRDQGRYAEAEPLYKRSQGGLDAGVNGHSFRRADQRSRLGKARTCCCGAHIVARS